MVWRNPFRRGVAPRPVVPDKNESDVSIVVVLCVAIMALTFAVAIPVLGLMYMDMWNATNAAVHEIKRMKELRKQVIEERREQWQRSNNSDN
jgi:hypothetical protein